MKPYLPYQLLLIVLFALSSCSSDSEDPAPEPEPDVVAPNVTFNIAGSSNTSGGTTPVFSNQITINISAQDAGGVAKVEAYISDQKVGEDVTSPFQIVIDLTGYTSKIPSSGKFQDYTLKIVATDTSGNQSSSEQVIHIDNELPAITNVSMGNGIIINGNTNAVTFSVSDNEGLYSVITYLNNSLLQQFTDENYEVNINTLNLSDGENNLRIEAVDLAGNTVDFDVIFIADNTGPEITLDSLEANQIVDEPMVLAPNVSDEYSGIDTVEFLLGDVSQLVLEGEVLYEWELDPAAYSTGTLSIFIKAVDTLGNENIVEFPIEILRRLITINIPTGFFNPQSARLFVFASDMDGQLLDVERIYSDTEIVKLHTALETNGDFEYMLTFGEYISGSIGNASEFTTVQNISPAVMPVMSLNTYQRFLNQSNSYLVPTENFDFNDQLNIVAQGFDYYGNFNQVESGQTSDISIVQRQNVNTGLQSNSFYLALYNNTLNTYSYTILDSNISNDLIITPEMFTNQGVEQRFYNPIMNGDPFESSALDIRGYLTQDDFNNNIYHLIDNHGYGYIPTNGIPYFFTDAFSNYKYTVRINDYFTERTGEPEASFFPVDWTVDYTFLNNRINLTTSGVGHSVGKIFIDSETPEIINGLNVSYRWNLVYDSQKMEQIVLPQIPDEIQSWGFYSIYENDGFKVQQVEIKGFQGITDYYGYLDGVIKNNKYSFTVSPNMESKFNSTSQGYYNRAPNFLLD
ncbi:MAG: hypothetical protein KDD31_02595 [Muricauda sp.]|nr:hypothetical protein [Allomuricauda sp.]